MWIEIKNFSNYEVNPYECKVRNKKTNNELKPIINEYPRVKMKNDIGVYKSIYCHRLFMQLLPGNGNQVNHKDGNKLNWNISNLELVTQSENIQHFIKNNKNKLKTNSGKDFIIYNKITNTEMYFPNVIDGARYIIKYYVLNIGLKHTKHLILNTIKTGEIYFKDHVFIYYNFKINKKDFKEYNNSGYLISTKGEIYSTKNNKLMNPVLYNDYYHIFLHINNKKIKKSIHRLVAETHIPNPDNLPVVDHIDKNKLNNCVDNLRWSTISDNAKNVDVDYTNYETSNMKPLIAKNKDGKIIYIFRAINHIENIGFKVSTLEKKLNRKTIYYKGLYWEKVSREDFYKLKSAEVCQTNC